jgi:hypothetical protein
MPMTSTGVEEPLPPLPNSDSMRFCQSLKAWSKSPPPGAGFLPQGLLFELPG